MNWRLIIPLFLVVLSIQVASARTIETSERPVYFVNQMTPNQYYYKNLDISNINGKELVSFEIIMTADFVSNTTFTLKINDVSCSPATWKTPNSGDVVNYVMSFDCSAYFGVGNVVSTDMVVLSYKSNKVVNNVRPKVREVYYVEDAPSMQVFGTEYVSGQNVKVWLQLLNSQGNYVNNGSCIMDVYSPDNEEYLIGAVMNNMVHDGIYYYDMIASLKEGVYPVIVKCYYDSVGYKFYVTSFTQKYPTTSHTIVSDNFQCNGFNCGSGWNADWQTTGVTIDDGITFTPLEGTSRLWSGMTSSGLNVYATVYGGDIYKQTALGGAFNALFQTARNWNDITIAPNNNVYATVYAGNIYMQTNQAGAFATLSQTVRNWVGITAAPNGDIYASVNGGDIYKRTGGTGNFNALSQTSRAWSGMTAASNGDIYAAVNGGDIYKQTGGTGNFIALGQTSRAWNRMRTIGSDIYATVTNGDIYKQTGGTGSFVALSQTSRTWTGITGATNGIYAAVNGGDIYKLTYNETYQLRSSGNFDVHRYFDASLYQNLYVNFTLSAISLEAGDVCHVEYTSGGSYWDVLTITDGQDDLTPIKYTYNVGGYGISSTSGIGFYATTNEAGDYCYLDNIVFYGTYTAPTTNINSMRTLNGVYSSFNEYEESGVNRLNLTLTLNNTKNCTNINSNLLTGVNIFVNGMFDSVPNDDLTFSLWNYTTNSWFELPNKLLEGGVFNSVTNFLQIKNITQAGIYNPSTGVKLRVRDSSFSDSTRNIFYADQVYLECVQFVNAMWQEVKGSSEIHISNANQEDFYVESLCGENSDDNSCVEFKNNQSFWNYTWGYLYENLTFINNFQKEVYSFYIYETQLGQDCTGVFEILKNGTSIMNDVHFSLGAKDNCKIQIPIVFGEDDRQFNIEIFQDNYMKWEMQRDKDYVNYFELALTPFCNGIAQENSNSYNIPISGNIDISALYINNPIYLGCYRALDDLYWFEKYYNDSLGINVAGEYESYLTEARFYYPELKSHAQIVQTLSSNEFDLMITPKTICGQNHNDYSCSLAMPPNSFFSSQEGYIKENVTIINNFMSTINTTYIYETATDIDCTAILDVIEVHGATNTSIKEDVRYALGVKKNCELTIPIIMDATEDKIQIIIFQENYIHWNMIQMTDKITSVRNNTQDYCDALATSHNITYQLPINQSISQYSNYSGLMFCYRAMDDLYWFDYFNAQHTTDELSGNETVGMMEAIYSEFQYFYPFIMENDNMISIFKRNNNQLLALGLLQNLSLNVTTPGVTFIGGTEYLSGENGRIAVRLVKSSGAAETGATCTGTILYPNLTTFVSSVSLSEYSTVGVYSYNFTTPITEGVYIYYIDCSNAGRTYKAMNTFHVNDGILDVINSLSSDVADIFDYLEAMNYSFYQLNNEILNNTNDIITQISILQMNITQSNITQLYGKLLYLQDMMTDMNDFSKESIFLITDSVVRADSLKNQTSINDIKSELFIIRDNLENIDSSNNKKSFINKSIVSYMNSNIIIIASASLMVVGLGVLIGKNNQRTRRIKKNENKKRDGRTVDVDTINRHD
jgi:hypothetical protein